VGWKRYVAFMGEMKNACTVLFGKLKGRDHLADLQASYSRWKVTITMDLKEIGSENVYCIDLTQDMVQ
jgi:hypothetical protein